MIQSDKTFSMAIRGVSKNMRKTKIICTIGPASDNEETLSQMFEAGMNVARLNFSHGTHEQHQEKIDLIKKVRAKMNLPIAIMLDTKGPEYRIKTFKDGKVELKDGATFVLTTDEIEGDETRVSVTYKMLPQQLNPGDRVLINNGLVILEVKEIKGSDVICEVVVGGVLSNQKSMNFPNKVMQGDFLSEQDKKDLLFGIKNEIDFVAASFVSRKEDMIEMRQFLDANGGENIEVIAKIENRADLGVEIPFHEVPSVQKQLIKRCRLLGRRVITATEMLESMINNPRPTRAEISDVANAVYDGSSAIMLSGESAAGKYPVEAVKTMSQVAEYTEMHINYKERFAKQEFNIRNNLDAISHATCQMAIDVGAKAIVVHSRSGVTARMVSRFRCPIDIVGMTTSERIWRRLNLSWGVIPILNEEFNSTDVMFYHGLNVAKDVLDLKEGDNVVMTGGLINGKAGNTNTIKVETVN